MLLVLIGFSYIDIGINYFIPNAFDKVEIQVSNDELRNELQQILPDFKLVNSLENPNKGIIYKLDTNELIFQQNEQLLVTIAFQQALDMLWEAKVYEEQAIDLELISTLENAPALNVEVVNPTNDEQGALSFILLTSIYFLILSFSTGIANEVIYEKATKTLELILTSVNARIHLISKLLVGWLCAIIQTILLFSYALIAIMLRNNYDQGEGLFKVFNDLNLLKIELFNFNDLFEYLSLLTDNLLALSLAIGILCIGMLTIQLILVVVSSFVSSLEEASTLQAPFYLILLGLYYLSLIGNNPYTLTYGWGRILSLLPIFSILFLPARLFINNISLIEIIISFSLASICFIILYNYLQPLYKIGVLDYSNQGLLIALKHKKRT